eukprot:1142569-Pelagomonas_calceolata.AAC.2
MQAFQDSRYRLQGVWREAELVDPRGNNNKLANYQAWFAIPFACNFPAHAHTLKVESAVWQYGMALVNPLTVLFDSMALVNPLNEQSHTYLAYAKHST